MRDAILATSDGRRRYEVAEVVPLHRSGDAMMYDLKLKQPIDPRDVGVLGIQVAKQPAQCVYARQVLDDPMFVAADTPLGYRCTSRTHELCDVVTDRLESRTPALRRLAFRRGEERD